MRSIVGLIVFVLLLIVELQAQRMRYANLKGTVIDSVSRQPLEAATVAVFLVADSSLITYAITTKKGEFLAKEIPTNKSCRVMISYGGLQSYILDFIISPEIKELIINTVQLRKSYVELEEVLVSAQRPPIMIKKDTLEFNAGSFKTSPNGVVEDLLKRLPGVEVDMEGNITVNGRKVSKITVDGKDFFGNDFKITSKNRPRDLIDKVQVVDYKTREAQLNKITTGVEEKVINLTLKKEKKGGLVGRASGGYGSDKRYESAVSLLSFNGPLQLQFIGYANNTNRSGLSGGDFSTGKPAGSLGSSSGISETRAAGLNFGTELNEKMRVDGSYFYENSELDNRTSVRRQNILPDTIYFYNSYTHLLNGNRAHRLNLNIYYKPDTLTDVYVNTSFNPTSFAFIAGNDAYFTTTKGETLNTAANTFSGESDDSNMGMEIFFGRRLNKHGRAFTLTMNYNYNHRMAIDANNGNTIFYQPDSSQVEDIIAQQSQSIGKNRRLGLSASFTEPVSKTVNMIFRYNYTNGNNHVDKTTHRLNPLTGRYDEVDTLFSNMLRNRHSVHAPNLSVFYNKGRLNSVVGVGMQWLELGNILGQAKNSFRQHYANVFPSANISYRFSETSSINFNYNGHSQQPSMDQLQQVPDNSNMLYVRLGNLGLKPSFYHNMSANLELYDSKSYWHAGLGWGGVTNQIVYETWFDSVQISRPINSNGNYSLFYNFSFSRNWGKRNWSLKLNIGNNGYHSRNTSFLNGIENITRTYSFSQRIGLAYSFKELITFMPTFTIRYSDSHYSIEETRSTENIAKSLIVNVFLSWPRRFVLENNIQYSYNSRTAPGFPKGVVFWSMAANYQLFKNRQALLRLSVYDLLKQNTSIYRSITSTYIEDTQAQVLQRYFLVSLVYNLKQVKR